MEKIVKYNTYYRKKTKKIVLHKKQNECIIMQYRTAHEKRYFTTAMRCINIGRKMLMQVCLYTIMG